MGGAITVKAWDTAGNAIAESWGATPLLLANHGTTTVEGTELIARFSAGEPMPYEFVVDSAKFLIQNVKSSYSDGLIKSPVFYRKGLSNFVWKLLKKGGPRSALFYYLHQAALNACFWQTRPCRVDYLVIRWLLMAASRLAD
jgi:hypothetical protein